MADDFSFDVVSKVDPQAVEDAVAVANKEITNRYDFRGSIARIDFNKKDLILTLFADNEMQLRNVADLMKGRMSKRGVPLKNLDFQKLEPAEKATVRQSVKVLQGIAKDKAKEMVAAIKKSGLKAQASIQDEQLRVSSRSKDVLQSSITLLKEKDFGLDLQFVNFR
ncbi:MAG: YajQ family cyclic di-GMP-binding protein [Elusimicrobia bacterium RIFCSPLOWO2_12_FULL_59_9]|nr:MAG: YajQ family cyclic di-GMP-binding protein [Elusimicrobia bacterium RIFCSPLOWO2_12_FULL_59_9]